MSLKKNFLIELKRESASTRKMLDRVPIDKLAWKPHEKSQSLEQLAKHIANLPNTLVLALTTIERDILNSGVPPLPPITSKEQLLELFDSSIEKAIKTLENTTDEIMKHMWTLRAGERIIFTMPKEDAVRYSFFNHSFHHRGQLSVYLRLLDVPVPGMYGPTADEKL
jgi:uncharacterized damage-inducible protein DinB